jgi:hypothetical protein
MHRLDDTEDLDNEDGTTRDHGGPERVRSQTEFRRTPPPKRRVAPVSYNGIHRRRKKRIQW